MKKLVLVPFLYILVACNINSNSISINSNEFSFIKEFTVSTPLDMQVNTPGGGISVEGYDKNMVEVKFIVRKFSSLLKISAEELEKYADYEIVADNQKLIINIKKIKVMGVSIGLSIKTPVATSCNLNSGGGGIDVKNLNGNITSNTGGGGIDIEQITGNVNCNTGGGGIDIVSVKGNVTANTGGGGIDLKNVDGNVDAKTGGGGIDIADVNGQVNAKTGGGGIDINNIKGSINASTGGGGISAKMSAISDKVQLSTGGGNININIPNGKYDLDIDANRIHSNINSIDGTIKKDRILGKLNGGGYLIKITSGGGSVDLNLL